MFLTWLALMFRLFCFILVFSTGRWCSCEVISFTFWRFTFFIAVYGFCSFLLLWVWWFYLFIFFQDLVRFPLVLSWVQGCLRIFSKLQVCSEADLCLIRFSLYHSVISLAGPFFPNYISQILLKYLKRSTEYILKNLKFHHFHHSNQKTNNFSKIILIQTNHFSSPFILWYK